MIAQVNEIDFLDQTICYCRMVFSFILRNQGIDILKDMWYPKLELLAKEHFYE